MPQTAVKPRKRPSQRRSQAKVEQIIDAVARLVESVGPDKITTNAVAREAGVSIGTIYQFFPNKEALLYALLESQLLQFNKTFQRFLDPAYDERPLPALIDEAIDALCDAYVKVPGMVNVMNAMYKHPEFTEAGARNNELLSGWLHGLLSRRAPELDSEYLALVAHTCIESADALMRKWLALEQGAALGEQLLIALKTMLHEYLHMQLASAN